MGLADFLALLGFVLAAGAALDFGLRTPTKRRIATRLLLLARAPGSSSLATSRFFDWLFGPSIFSFRSLIATCAFTLMTLTVAAIIAVLSSPADFFPFMINIFPKGISFVACSVLFITLVTTVVVDYLSYAKTRVFIRTIALYPQRSFISILILSDIMASLSIFIVLFSVGLMLCNLVTIYSVSPLTGEYTLIPSFAADLAKSGKLDGKVVKVFKTPNLEKYLRWSDSKGAMLDFVSYKLIPACFGREQAGFAYFGTGMLAERISDSYHWKIDRPSFFDAVGTIAKVAESNRKGCVKGVVSNRQIDLLKLLSEIPMTDLYFASLSATLHELTIGVSFKFEQFEQIDPFETPIDFLHTALIEKEARFLGWKRDEQAKMLREMLSYNHYEQKNSVKIPFSLLATTSLGASVMFLIFLFVGLLSQIVLRARRAIGRIAPILHLRTAPFTSIAIAGTLFCICAMLFFSGVAALWKVALSVA